MVRFFSLLCVGLVASSLSLAGDRPAAPAERSLAEEAPEAAEAYMEQVYDEGIFFEPGEPGEPGIQAAVKICVDGSGWCLETDSYVDCNDWIASYDGEPTPSGISCYDLQ